MKLLRRLIVTFPFTLVGLFSNMFLVLAIHGVIPVEGLWRVLLLPAYSLGLALAVVLQHFFGASGPPNWSLPLIILPVRFLPFLLADYALARLRRRRQGAHFASH
jgi:hypothetical protein